MSKNLISEIVKLLGVEMEEAFKIRRPDYEVCENGIYAFFENEGLMKKNKQGVFDSNSSIEFEDLCLGNYEVVKLPWEPEPGDTFWYPNPIAKKACNSAWYPTVDKLAYRALGLVFRTESEAQDHMDEATKLLLKNKQGEQNNE